MLNYILTVESWLVYPVQSSSKTVIVPIEIDLWYAAIIPVDDITNGNPWNKPENKCCESNM